jgi:hypothetical protein
VANLPREILERNESTTSQRLRLVRSLLEFGLVAQLSSKPTAMDPTSRCTIRVPEAPKTQVKKRIDACYGLRLPQVLRRADTGAGRIQSKHIDGPRLAYFLRSSFRVCSSGAMSRNYSASRSSSRVCRRTTGSGCALDWLVLVWAMPPRSRFRFG